MLAITAVVLTGCTAPSPGAEAACAAILEIDGHTYWGHGEGVRRPEQGAPVGTGTAPGCDDGHGASDAYDLQVFELPGTDPEQAVIDADGWLWIAAGADLPDIVRATREPVSCDWEGARTLSGAWISVMGGPTPRFDGDLRVAHELGLVVDGADVGLPSWRTVTVRVHVDEATEPRLDKQDVQQALWSPGTLTIRVHCDRNRFVAESADTAP